MKKIVFLILLGGLFFAQCTPKIAESDTATKDKMEEAIANGPSGEAFRKMAPKAGPAPIIEVGSAESFTLSNGLKVLVSENHKLPRVSFQVFIDVPPILEKEYVGTTSITGQLLSTGTISKSKAEIDEAVDFMGATLNTGSNGIFAASLKKHTENLMAIASDVLLKPSFPKAEFEKIKKQTLSGLAASKEDPNAIASNVSTVIRNGKDHPYGEIPTEESIEKITLSKTKEYYNKYFKPNIGYLIIVGDITAAEARPLAEKYFGSWGKGTIQKEDFPTPRRPDVAQVDFVSKTGAVQSVINITYPVELKPNSNDWIKARIMNTILGGFFGSRVQQNLREDKAYTYGAGTSLSNDPYIGSFSASASVRNEVTADAIREFLNEMNRLRTEKVSDQELTTVKNLLTGRFARALENPQTVARFALSTSRFNLPADYYTTYLERLNAVTAADVLAMAQKYVTPDNAHILVVGNRSEVAESLKQFAKNGEINYYDTYGTKLVMEESATTANMTAEQVINKYLGAIGGKDKLKAVKDLSMTMEADMMGQAVTMNLIQKSPNKIRQTLSAGGMVVQSSTFNGEKGIIAQMGQSKPMSAEEIKTTRNQAVLFSEMKLAELGYQSKLIGTENVDGNNAFLVELTSSEGKKQTLYFDANNFLKIKEVSVVEGPQGQATITTDLSDYKRVNGILFPHTRKVTGMGPMPLKMVVKEIKVNAGVEDSAFKVE